MMLYKIRLLIICLSLVGFVSILKAQEPQGTSGEQLLLLRNGQALEGRIIQSGDFYRVICTDGEIRIKAADVELLCKDFEEGYQRKRAAVSTGSLRDHLDLAQWCQQHKLYDHAASELADAAAIAPENPMVGFLQRRLQIAREPVPDRPKAKTSGDNSLSNEELDRMIRGLPHKAVENFTQSVQPLLMNNCTFSGCHGPQSESGLRLQRTALDQPAGRRLTQRNIQAVLRYVDRDNPLASRILTVPTAPHGTAKTAVFSERQAMQYKRLVDWVLQLGPADMPESPATIANSQPVMAETLLDAASGATTPHILSQDARKARPLSSVSPGTAGVSPVEVSTPGVSTNLRSASGLPNNAAAAAAGMSGNARSSKPATIPKHEAAQAVFQYPLSKPDEPEASADSAPKAPKIKRGVAPPEFTPKDPFDPEIFNSRYFRLTTADGSSTTDKSTGGE
ncbi:MAG: hypothetical protein ABSA16_08485 [Thermoguttaceae bacterium]|jgi:hypothetical protein